MVTPMTEINSQSILARAREVIGIEIDPLYCVWAGKRLETADADPAIQGYADGVFWERNSRPRPKRR